MRQVTIAFLNLRWIHKVITKELHIKQLALKKKRAVCKRPSIAHKYWIL